MKLETQAKRPMCVQCLRPRSACICQWVRPVVHASEVLILQHPLEIHQAKNSGRLLHLSLPGSRILVGERLDAREWDQALKVPKTTVLLYPPTELPGHAPTPSPDPEQMKDLANVRLVVIDATWRKSRKMLHLNPALQQLPRLALDVVPSSRYLIRKAHKPGQLSTLEATCAALAQLGCNAEALEPLLAAFEGFVAQQASFSHPQPPLSPETTPRCNRTC
jgi:DTW domain-containing protein YfiP